MATKRTSSISELLENRVRRQAAFEKAKTAFETATQNIIKEVLGGRTTGLRYLDFALIFRRSFDEKDGQFYVELEEKFQEHAGQVVMMTSEWQEDGVQRFAPHTALFEVVPTEMVVILGAISPKPQLAWSKYGGLLIPIDRAIILHPSFRDAKIEVIEVEGGQISPLQLHSRLEVGEPYGGGAFVPGAVVLPRNGQLLFGTEAVFRNLVADKYHLTCLRHLDGAELETLVNEYLAALGMETFDSEGQGRLAIPAETT